AVRGGRAMKRAFGLGFSVAVHGAVIAAAVGYRMWRVEEVPAPARPLIVQVVDDSKKIDPGPPSSSGGGHGAQRKLTQRAPKTVAPPTNPPPPEPPGPGQGGGGGGGGTGGGGGDGIDGTGGTGGTGTGSLVGPIIIAPQV